VETTYRLLVRKIAGRSIVVNNEASLQLHFSHILSTLGKLYEFSSTELFHVELEGNLPLSIATVKSRMGKARADILLSLGENQFFSTCALELKFFKKNNESVARNRYRAFADLANLESYGESLIDECYLVLATDDIRYVSCEGYSAETSSFDLRHGTKYISGTELRYQTSTPPGASITLTNSYEFGWETFPVWGRGLQNIYCQSIHCRRAGADPKNWVHRGLYPGYDNPR
jgi:hypothetical protein